MSTSTVSHITEGQFVRVTPINTSTPFLAIFDKTQDTGFASIYIYESEVSCHHPTTNRSIELSSLVPGQYMKVKINSVSPYVYAHFYGLDRDTNSIRLRVDLSQMRIQVI